MKQKGFTLIELMVVIVILGILAGIAIPKMFGLSDKSKISEAPTVLKTYETLQQAYIAEQSKIGNFNSITFNAPSASQYFNYTDEGNFSDTGGCGLATATSKVKIGDCAVASKWQSGVPNSKAETKRGVSGASASECIKLSPATYQKEGAITASAAGCAQS